VCSSDLLDGDEDDERQKHECVHERRKHFCSHIAIGRAPAWRPARDPRREQGKSERRGIGGHVAGVREKRKGARPEGAGRFEQAHPARDDERPHERAMGCTQPGRMIARDVVVPYVRMRVLQRHVRSSIVIHFGVLDQSEAVKSRR